MKVSLESEGLVLKEQLPSLTSEASECSTLGCFSNLGFQECDEGRTLIPYKNILWASPSGSGAVGEVKVSYVRADGKTFSPQSNVFTVSDPKGSSGKELAERLMGLAYPTSKPGRSVLVVINPHGGRGKAVEIYKTQVESILIAAHCKIVVVETRYHRHAIDIARELDINKYDMILCASGDGIPHEIINGLYQRKDRAEAFDKLIVTQTPSGSGNAMSLSCLGTLVPSAATLELLKGPTVTTDLMAIYGADGPVRLSFLSQTYGAIAQADIGTEFMRWVGPARFDLGVTYQTVMGKRYPCDLAVKYLAKTTDEMTGYYRQHSVSGTAGGSGSGTVGVGKLTEANFQLQYYDQFHGSTNVNDLSNLDDWELYDTKVTDNLAIFYAGKMPYIAKDTNFFPAALPNDGSIDVVVTDSRAGVLANAKALLSIDKGLHVWKDEVDHFKVAAYRLIPVPLKNTFFSVDGENFTPRPLQVEVLRGIMKTILQGGTYTDTGFYEHAVNHSGLSLSQ